jgi:hypothetical protein
MSQTVEDDVTSSERGFKGHNQAQSCTSKIHVAYNRA